MHPFRLIGIMPGSDTIVRKCDTNAKNNIVLNITACSTPHKLQTLMSINAS